MMPLDALINPTITTPPPSPATGRYPSRPGPRNPDHQQRDANGGAASSPHPQRQLEPRADRGRRPDPALLRRLARQAHPAPRPNLPRSVLRRTHPAHRPHHPPQRRRTHHLEMAAGPANAATTPAKCPDGTSPSSTAGLPRPTPHHPHHHTHRPPLPQPSPRSTMTGKMTDLVPATGLELRKAAGTRPAGGC